MQLNTTTRSVQLLLPIYVPLNPNILHSLRWFIKSILVNFKIDKISIVRPSKRFTELQISGGDAKVAANFLRELFGGPMKWEDISFGKDLIGRVMGIQDGYIKVDIGLVEPDYLKVIVSGSELLKSVLNIEKKVGDEELKLMGIHRYLPFKVKVFEDSEIDYEKREIKGKASGDTIKTLRNWLKSRFDRLLVFGATRSAIIKALDTTRHKIDVINVERIGFLEHSIVCKWGTSSVGLIPELGDYLPNAKFLALRPRYFKKLLRMK
ncbi:MAG: DUF2110 family protein [Candidatus Njordarchaeia archaeon]